MSREYGRLVPAVSTGSAGSARPKVAGIVGTPRQVASSLSPAIHNAAFRELGLDWVYITLGMDEASLIDGLLGLVAGGVKGMNVTMPHKVNALPALDSLSKSAARIGAVNTIEVVDGRMTGHNTDGQGLVRFLERDAGASIKGSVVLVIGAGGSARAAVDGVAQAGAAKVVVVARDLASARALASLKAESVFELASFDQAGDEVSGADIIINATPVGQKGEALPFSVDHISSEAVVVDLVYRPPVTPLIEAARSKGAVAHSGLGMLLHQAALSFEIWTGLEPPMESMSAAALAELASGEPSA